MSEHKASIRWRRGTPGFAYEEYNREHDWEFDGGVRVPASAAPGFKGKADRVDPEEAFIAALSSCHMLTFLALAARKRYVVDSYEDDAVGHLEKDERGRMAVTRVILRPRARFAPAGAPSPEEISRLHAQAHELCFIANSVRTEVAVET